MLTRGSASGSACFIEARVQHGEARPGQFTDGGIAAGDSQQNRLPWAEDLWPRASRPVDVGRNHAQASAVPEAANRRCGLGEPQRCAESVRRDGPRRPEGAADVLVVDHPVDQGDAALESGGKFPGMDAALGERDQLPGCVVGVRSQADSVDLGRVQFRATIGDLTRARLAAHAPGPVSHACSHRA